MGAFVEKKLFDELLESKRKLDIELKLLRNKATYRVYQENMNLMDEIVRLKAELNKNRPLGPVEEVPELEFKYTLIISQYYYSRHMFIVHHTADFIEKAKEFSKELMEYKRDFKGRKVYLGDLDYWKDHTEIKPRYNINDSGDIYFIQSNFANKLAGDSRQYKADSIRESKGYIKKAISEAINEHHNYEVVKNLIEKYFVIA